MAFNIGSTGGPVSEINVTPLVDVMLVLLIIFMVTATVEQASDDERERQVHMNVPRTTEGPTEASQAGEKLILRIGPTLEITLGEEPVANCASALSSEAPDRFEDCFELVADQLMQNERVVNESEVYILADIYIPYGFVVGILSRIRQSGVDTVGMVTNPEILRLVGSDAETPN